MTPQENSDMSSYTTNMSLSTSTPPSPNSFDRELNELWAKLELENNNKRYHPYPKRRENVPLRGPANHNHPDKPYYKAGGRWYFTKPRRDQREHPLSYNPIRRPHPYALNNEEHHIPDAITIASAFRKALPRPPPINGGHIYTPYPSQVTIHCPYQFNDDWFLRDIDYDVISHLADYARTLPSRYRLLNLQQAQWVLHHLDQVFWPTQLMGHGTTREEVDREAAATTYGFIEEVFGEDLHRQGPLEFHGK